MENNDPARDRGAERLKPMANIGAIMPAPDTSAHGSPVVPRRRRARLPGRRNITTTCARITNMDTAERIDPKALKQAATVMAGVLDQAAMREGTFAKPAPPAKLKQTQ